MILAKENYIYYSYRVLLQLLVFRIMLHTACKEDEFYMYGTIYFCISPLNSQTKIKKYRILNSLFLKEYFIKTVWCSFEYLTTQDIYLVRGMKSWQGIHLKFLVYSQVSSCRLYMYHVFLKWNHVVTPDNTFYSKYYWHHSNLPSQHVLCNYTPHKMLWLFYYVAFPGIQWDCTVLFASGNLLRCNYVIM